jgi:hypothetical protein
MPTTIRALSGSDFKWLDQRRRGAIGQVGIADGPCLETAKLLCLKDVRAYRGATRHFGGRLTPRGYVPGRLTPRGFVLFSDGTAGFFSREGWEDGEVLYNDQRAYLFECAPTPDCPFRWALVKSELVAEILSINQTLSLPEQCALRDLAAERVFEQRQPGYVASMERVLQHLELSTLRGLLQVLRSGNADASRSVCAA